MRATLTVFLGALGVSAFTRKITCGNGQNKPKYIKNLIKNSLNYETSLLDHSPKRNMPKKARNRQFLASGKGHPGKVQAFQENLCDWLKTYGLLSTSTHPLPPSLP